MRKSFVGHTDQVIHRRHVLRAGMALGVVLVAPSAPACEFYTSNLTIIHPWTRASAEGATSAVVSMKFQDVTQADRLVGVQTPVADGVELRGEGAGPAVDFAIEQGQTPALSEAGVHLRLVGLRHPLLVGREYPMTLEFARAGQVQAKLTVDYARFG